MGDNKRKRSHKSGTKPAPTKPPPVVPSADADVPETRLFRSLKASRAACDNASVSAAVRVVPAIEAVVKVFCVHTAPNFSLPWQWKRQYSSNSSGFVIGGRRVLTNAHSVEHYTQVKVKRRGSDVKYLAKVFGRQGRVRHWLVLYPSVRPIILALLTADDDEFWRGVTPLEFGGLPALQDAVTVGGYPIGGDSISCTSGVVSRIEILSYVHDSTEPLGVQDFPFWG